jgi:signal transduction histidine kinase
MNDRLPRRVALVSLALLAAIVAVVAWEPRAGGEGFWLFVLIGGSLSIIWGVVGALITSREPRNPIGWIVLAVGLVYGVWGFTATLGPALMFRDRDSAAGLGLSWVAAQLPGILVVLPFLFLLFPTGRVLSPRWRWVAWLLGAGGVAAVVATALTPDPTLNVLFDVGISAANPTGVGALEDLGGSISLFAVITVLVAGVLACVSLVLRYRRSSDDERQQIRWLAFVGAAAAGFLIVQILFGLTAGFLGPDTGTGAEWIFVALFLGFVVTLAVGIPLATGVAILKYRLYDLDIVVRKTVQYAVVVAAFAVAAGLVVLAIQFTFLGADAEIVPVVLLAAALSLAFVWVRGPARRLADRIVYGTRATPYEVLSAFSERVGETYAAEDVLPRMAAVLGEGAGAEQATVWLRIGGAVRPAGVWPSGSDAPADLPDDAVEVTHQGEPLGALSIRMPVDDPMNPSKEKLVRDLAAQAGLVLRNVRLIEELRDSRRRLVAAQDEERRRIERNIHDGVQQQLLALAVKLRLADASVGRDDEKTRELLQQLQVEATETVEDLRDLARGIYPPLLADQGLAAAIKAQARRSPVPVELAAEPIGRYPRDVESTVYFSVLEALQNVTKYAQAEHVDVRISDTAGEVWFEVRDDGVGFDPQEGRVGTGLQGMADRLATVGGRLEVDSSPGSGTTVRGSIPTVGST